METPPDPEPAPKGPLDGLLGITIDGIASYAASAVRDGLSHLIHSEGSAKRAEKEGSDDGSAAEEPAKPAPGIATGPTLILAVAVAALVTVILVGRSSSSQNK